MRNISSVIISCHLRNQKKCSYNLSSGNNNGLYHFVSAKVAKQIEERDPRRIIVAHGRDEKPPEPGSDEEFYAKFEVPDDLDW